MVFSTITFLFLFLPLILIIYSLLLPNLRNFFLFMASMFFYTWGEIFYVILFIICIINNYILGLLVEKYRRNTDQFIPGILVSLTVLFNLGFLSTFKYSNFIVDNINVFAGFFGFNPIELDPVHLPIGISFFVFQAMSYVIDIYRGDVKATRSLLNFATYISFFPQLIAGPIVRYKDVAIQLVSRKLTAEKTSSGIRRFIIGLSKKVLIANTVAEIADKIFIVNPSSITFGMAWLGIICYAIQIYFDFSGYSDMAIGLGRVFGFEFLENFNYPYISSSIKEFWRRWHISLSTWFRDYLYFPLGGARVSKFRTYLNLIIVFFLCGLWHGSTWNFVIWGLWNGMFLVFERLHFKKVLEKIWPPLRHTYVLLIVCVGWVFFRSDTLDYSIGYLKAMFAFSNATGIEYDMMMYVNRRLLVVLIAAITFSMPVIPLIKKQYLKYQENTNSNKINNLLFNQLIPLLYISGLFAILFLCSLSLASGTHNPFIYFRF